MGIVLTISLFTKCDGVRISCCVRFVIPFKLSCAIMNVEIRLLINVLSSNFVLKIKSVMSIVNGNIFI